MDIINQLNWVDIVICGIIARIIYIAIKRGIIIEAFKLIGTLFTVLVTLHYYSSLSVVLQERIHFPEGVADFVSFGFLWLVVALIFKLIRDGFLVLLTVQAHSLFDRWGSVVFAVVRAVLLCSLVVLFLRLTAMESVVRNTEKSWNGSRLVGLAPRLYEACYNGFISKFFPTEELNKSIFTVAYSASKNSKQ